MLSPSRKGTNVHYSKRLGKPPDRQTLLRNLFCQVLRFTSQTPPPHPIQSQRALPPLNPQPRAAFNVHIKGKKICPGPNPLSKADAKSWIQPVIDTRHRVLQYSTPRKSLRLRAGKRRWERATFVSALSEHKAACVRPKSPARKETPRNTGWGWEGRKEGRKGGSTHHT